MFKASTPLIGIIVAIGLFFMYIRPTFEEVKVIQDEAAQYAQAVEKASALQQRINELKAQQNSISLADLERLEAFLPDRVDEVAILIDIDTLAKAYNLLLGDIEVGAKDAGSTTPNSAGTLNSLGKRPDAIAPPFPRAVPEEEGAPGVVLPHKAGSGENAENQYSKLDIGFTVAGTYDDFRMFLAELERSLVLMEVTEIAFSDSEGDSIPFEVTISLYSLNASPS